MYLLISWIKSSVLRKWMVVSTLDENYQHCKKG